MLQINEPVWFKTLVDPQENHHLKEDHLDNLDRLKRASIAVTPENIQSLHSLKFLGKKSSAQPSLHNIESPPLLRPTSTAPLIKKVDNSSKKRQQHATGDIEAQQGKKSVGKKWLKTVMSNERLLLSWLNPIVVLLSVSVTLMGLGTGIVKIFGLVIASLAGLFSLYALFMFHRRRFAIGIRTLVCGHDEPCGPTIIVCLIVAALIAVSIITIINGGMIFNSVVSPVQLSGNDTMLDSKQFEVSMSWSNFSMPREFATKQFITTFRQYPRASEMNASVKITYTISRAQNVILKDPFTLGKFISITVLEPLVYDSMSSTLKRPSDDVISLSIEMLDVNSLASFVPLGVDYKQLYISSIISKRIQRVSCDHAELSYLTTVELNVPASYQVPEPSSMYSYFEKYQQLQAASVLSSSTRYSYTVAMDAHFSGEPSVCNLVYQYATEQDLMQHKSSEPVDFVCSLNQASFNKGQRVALNFHQYLCL